VPDKKLNKDLKICLSKSAVAPETRGVSGTERRRSLFFFDWNPRWKRNSRQDAVGQANGAT